MALPQPDETEDDAPKGHGPCALCEGAEGKWLVFGGRWFCGACCNAWADSDRWPEDRVGGAFAPTFEIWFAEMKAKRGAA